MTAFSYRMPAGIPGALSRATGQDTVSQELYDSAATFSAFGLPAKMGSNGKVQPMGAGDAATALYGILVRPYPVGASQDGLGVSTPATSGIANVLRRGWINVKLGGTAPATKKSQVYVRVANAAAGKPIGGFEAAADSTNTVAPAGLFFTGPADANGNAEVEFNL